MNEKLVLVASENFTLDPTQVLSHARDFFVATLHVHLTVMQKLHADRDKAFDVQSVLRGLLDDVEKHVLKSVKPLEPKSKVVRLAPVVPARSTIL
jgi:hypothetical protein